MKVGDVVRLKSGGPWMTVTAVSAPTIQVAWFNGGGFATTFLPEEVLVPEGSPAGPIEWTMPIQGLVATGGIDCSVGNTLANLPTDAVKVGDNRFGVAMQDGQAGQTIMVRRLSGDPTWVKTCAVVVSRRVRAGEPVYAADLVPLGNHPPTGDDAPAEESEGDRLLQFFRGT